MLTLTYRFLLSGMWLAWIVYWWLSSANVKHTVRREPLGSRLLHVIPLTIAAMLLLPVPMPSSLMHQRLFPWAPWQFWLACVITAAGLLFSVWARVHLGRNWSAVVTIKQDHELITTGPYAMVRHPIYTGLLSAFIGCAFARADLRGLIGVAIAFAAIWRKLRFEERWMTERFGERYAEYARRVPALAPFLR